MKRQPLVLLLVSLGTVSAALATTYVRVEKDGTKTYSDRPIPGGQPVDLQPAQTYSTPEPAVTTPSQQRREEQLVLQTDNFRYETCAASPENDATFQNPVSVTIAVSTNPPLRSGDLVSITVDGQRVNADGSLSYTMTPVYRGTHTIGVNVANTYGALICNSSSVFHVQQPGQNSPARQPRPRPR